MNRVPGKRSIYMWVMLLAASPGFASLSQQNPHGAGFSLECALCHTVSGWSDLRPVLEFDHGATVFPLEGRHRQVDCAFCHESLEFAQAPRQCAGCHLDVHTDQFGEDCERCHDPGGWIDESRFREMHEESRFSLTGAHSGLDCAVCHGGGQYVNLPLDCAGCHYDSWVETDNPNHAESGYGTDCSVCHGLAGADWASNIVAFDHSPAFPLIRGHHIFDCDVCHTPGMDFADTPTECYACHRRDYERTGDPNHVAAGFPTDCSICHSIGGWDDAENFNHSTTGFPLTGEHRNLDCNACHAQGYAGTPVDCDACHQGDFDAATNPPHDPAEFDSDCSVCHTTDGWSPAPGFNHNSDTNYPLTGTHTQVDCADCHAGGIYAGLSDVCFDCHEADYNDAEDPNHLTEGYPTDCEACHSTTQWDDAQFDHAATDFPLTGAHVETSCGDCHQGGIGSLDVACVSCHQGDFDDAADPVHTVGSFDADCTVCHSTDAWQPSSFNHDTDTDFTLEGAHVTRACADCHLAGQYTGTPQTCYGCHQDDFTGVGDPDHAAGNYSQDCTECHSQNDWIAGAGFAHGSVTGYELTGAHATLDCADCHAAGYAGTPADCFACHEDDYNGADDPDHVANSYPHDCTICHNTSDWGDAVFDHGNTDFPLTGAHTQLECAACHAEGYTGTPAECYACHEEDFANADPPHEPGAFGTDCTACHTTAAWSPSTFNHNNQTDYDLTGSHVTVACTQCHAGGQYTGTPDVCFFCHETDYNQTNDPDHENAGFPTDCELCHNTIAWNDAEFNHDPWFPIYSGNHRDEWDSCSDCHPNPDDYTEFTCLTCHHQGDMNEEHQDVQGYVYESEACYECHPNGGGDVPPPLERYTEPEADPKVTD